MEILTNHRDGSKSVALKSGRTLKLSAEVYDAILKVNSTMQIYRLYMHVGAGFFIGGWGKQYPDWLAAWDSYKCLTCGYSGIADIGSKCASCDAWISRREVEGHFEPFVSGSEYGELICGLNSHYKQFDTSKIDTDTIFRAVKVANLRVTAVWQIWKNENLTGSPVSIDNRGTK